ncbi:TPA: ribosomal protein S18-alanine N-acetyltransferase [Pasteurella multocida]|nr:ribosomal protein S18-alanine N-acetyltransferase [Pasteurella multocida]HDR1190271.1 ribosomal protein S18-alanine N-acetyltransferase [Pasteurella multocida]HDR1192763.1 ribosomal protein S18-alanine N-acetyltransferase [Pasteurella multocida]HDR1200872.1 ribosomal protein S18-alanine N-acetyltransferase [Pasteurella multocida]HDR1211316.1 ribosomal protein S18-alanine N-acetyltransferase [Pasteurella multocida]
MMIITQITEHDLERLFEIEQSAHLVPWSMGILKNTQGENYLNLKLTYYDQIIAFAICQHILDEATLLNIAVAPSFQGKGFGKQLLNHLLQQLTEKGISTLWLEVRESNITAQKLYEQLGFNEVDRRKNYYPTPHGQRENAIVMARYL